jgi:hypothetical protein
MLPLTLMAAQKVANLLTINGAIQQQIAAIGQSCHLVVPPIPASQVVVTSAGPAIGDLDAQLTYPRVCIYSAGFRNSHIEKFRAVSGTIAITAEIWSSDNLVTSADQWIHFYVEAVTSILRGNVGDWGDGISFGGAYEVQLQAPKVGGLGYVESAKVNVTLTVSRN